MNHLTKPILGYFLIIAAGMWAGVDGSQAHGAVALFNFASTNLTFAENAGTAVLTVTRSGDTSGTNTLRFATKSQTADAGDFVAADGELVFAPGERTKPITVTLENDALDEDNETFLLCLSDPSAGAALGPRSVARVTILDDEVSIGFQSLSYSNSEAGPVANIAVRRFGPLSEAVAVNFATTDGTAQAGLDYQSTNGTLVLPANTPQRSFTVRLLNDALVEGGETVQLRLFSPSNALLAAAATNAVLTLGDDDRGGLIQFALTNITTTEAGRQASVLIHRTAGLASNVTVRLVLTDGPTSGGATRPEDYAPTNAAGTVTNELLLSFAANETRKIIRVPLVNDQLAEGAEVFHARLEAPTGGAQLGARSNAVVTVRDDDLGGKISFSRAAYTVNENATQLALTIARSGGAASNVTVRFQALAGGASTEALATAGEDFLGQTTTLSFGPGQTTTNVAVSILDDSRGEGSEQFSLLLTDPQGGATVGPLSNAVVTIVDDESTVTFTNRYHQASEGAGSLVVGVKRGGSLATAIRVDVTVTDGSATRPGDHRTTNTTLVFPPNVPIRTLVVPLVNDTVAEPAETLTLSLVNPQGGVSLGGITNTVVGIRDNDIGTGTLPEQAARLDGFVPDVNGPIYAFAVQPDGKVLIGGDFTLVAGQLRPGLARLHANGSLDADFDPGVDRAVYSLLVQADGAIVVGGEFTQLGGQNRPYLARLHPDGTIDETFQSVVEGGVYVIAAHADGRIVVAGDFGSVAGQPRSGIARLRADGTLAGGFTVPVQGGIFCLAVQRNGGVIAGGDFTVDERDEDGDVLTYFNVIRFDSGGSFDEDFYPDPDGMVTGLLLLPNERILMSGEFTRLQDSRANYVRRSGLARLDSKGNVEKDFDPSPDGPVRAMALQADGRILLAGSFSAVAGQPRGGLARVHGSGRLDTNFTMGTDGSVRALAVQNDGGILLAGDFASVEGQTRGGLARVLNTVPALQSLRISGSTLTWMRGGACPGIWHAAFEHSADGVNWTSLGAGTYIPGGWQRTGLSVPNGRLVRARGLAVGGSSIGSGWQPVAYAGPPVLLSQPSSRTNNQGTTATFTALAGGDEPLSYQWERDGLPLANQGNTTGANLPTMILSAVSVADTGDYRLVVSNPFGSVSSSVARLLVRDPFFVQQPAGTNARAGQRVTFTVQAGGTPPLHYQWHRNGTPLSGATDTALALPSVSTADIASYTVTVRNGAGSITSAPALLSVNLATVDAGFNPVGGFDFNAEVSALALQPDGRVLVGGTFTTLAGEPRRNLGLINADGSLDRGFVADVFGGQYSGVRCLAVQRDGRILVGGVFTNVAGQPRKNLTRLHPDGTVDSSFQADVTSDDFAAVLCLAVQPDGKILVGGTFTNLGGLPRDNLGRLLPDGTVDSSFNPGTDFDLDSDWFLPPSVLSLVVQADGRILVGGSFTSLAGQRREGLGRLHADGSLDASFNPGADFFVSTMAEQPDGKILVGGAFEMLAGQPRCFLGRLHADGSLDTTFTAGTGGQVQVIALQTDGRMAIGGLFDEVNGQLRNFLARLEPDGTLDGTFSPGMEGGFRSLVSALALQPDGRWIVGGEFDSLDGQARNDLARLNNTAPAFQALEVAGSILRWRRSGSGPEVGSTAFEYSSNGTEWTSLGAGTRVPDGWERTGTALPPGSTLRAIGRVVAGGISDWLVEAAEGPPTLLTQPASQTKPFAGTATFNARVIGSSPLDLKWFRNGVALAPDNRITGLTEGTLVIQQLTGADAGDYHLVASNALGRVSSLMARLTVVEPVIIEHPSDAFAHQGGSAMFSVVADGSPELGYQWQRNGLELAGATSPELMLTNVSAPDIGTYTVVVANSFGSVTSAPALLAVNLAGIDNSFVRTANNTVLTLLPQSDGKTLVGGTFTRLSTSTRSALGRLNADTTVDAAFNPGVSGGTADVYALAIQPDGRILVGGTFTNLSGQFRSRLGRLSPEGILDDTFSPAASGSVDSLALQPDGKILVAGAFTNLAGQTRLRIGRLNPDGTLDPGFNPAASSSVQALLVQPDGKILVGGTFTNLAGQPRSRLGRLHPDGSLDTSFNPRADGVVQCLALQPDGRILVGGSFTNLNLSPRARLARLHPDGSLDEMFTPGASGSVYSMVIQCDGKIQIGGTFSSVADRARLGLARLNPDGTLDPDYDPQAGGYGHIYSLALQADGKTLVGGLFSGLVDAPRSQMGRLHATSPATSSLDLANSTLTWLRGGTSPEATHVTFDHSSDGTNWTRLGAGTRIPGGWHLTGVAFPPTDTVRARAYFVSGIYNGSGSFVEATLNPGFAAAMPVAARGQAAPAGNDSASPLATPFPDAPAATGPDGVTAPAPRLSHVRIVDGAQVQFTISTIAGRSYQIEYLDDLSAPAWAPLGGARRATGDTLAITDPLAPGRQRLYRATLLP